MTPFKPDYASQRDKRQKLTCCGWATEECDGRRLPASPEQLEEEERDNAYDKAGFLSFMEYGGFDLRQVEY